MQQLCERRVHECSSRGVHDIHSQKPNQQPVLNLFPLQTTHRGVDLRGVGSDDTVMHRLAISEYVHDRLGNIERLSDVNAKNLNTERKTASSVPRKFHAKMTETHIDGLVSKGDRPASPTRVRVPLRNSGHTANVREVGERIERGEVLRQEAVGPIRACNSAERLGAIVVHGVVRNRSGERRGGKGEESGG